MSLTGEPDGAPMKVGVPIADVFAGLYGTIGVLAALRHQERTGLGHQIDIGMLDTNLAWLANQAMNYLATGSNPPRLGNEHPNIVPYQVFATADGHIMLSIGNDTTFARFCREFGLEERLADDRFATNAARVAHRAEVAAMLAPVLAAESSAWWLGRLEALKIGCGPINSLKEVFADPQILAREALFEMEHDSGAAMKLVANPVRLSETPANYRLPPPVLGQHTDQVLEKILDMSSDEVAALRRQGVI